MWKKKSGINKTTSLCKKRISNSEWVYSARNEHQTGVVGRSKRHYFTPFTHQIRIYEKLCEALDNNNDAFRYLQKKIQTLQRHNWATGYLLAHRFVNLWKTLRLKAFYLLMHNLLGSNSKWCGRTFGKWKKWKLQRNCCWFIGKFSIDWSKHFQHSHLSFFPWKRRKYECRTMGTFSPRCKGFWRTTSGTLGWKHVRVLVFVHYKRNKKPIQIAIKKN